MGTPDYFSYENGDELVVRVTDEGLIDVSVFDGPSCHGVTMPASSFRELIAWLLERIPV
jgi:hypothetical protein